MRDLKIGLRSEDIKRLYHEQGIKNADDLYYQRLEIMKSNIIAKNRIAVLEYATIGPNAVPLQEVETHTILNLFEQAALKAGLKSEPIGSLRRGIYGGHDIDIMLQLDPDTYNQQIAQASVIAANTYSLIPSPEEEIFKLANEERRLSSFLQHLEDMRVEFVQIRGLGHGKVNNSKTPHPSHERLSVSHIVLRAPKFNSWRKIDIVFAPNSIYSLALLGWSGSRTFVRSFRERAKVLHKLGFERNGTSGWNLDERGNRQYPPVYNRVLDFQAGEHWEISQNGVFISSGSHSAHNLRTSYEEDPANFPHERAIFEFFHLDFRPPQERSC